MKKGKVYFARSASQTKNLGKRLAKKILLDQPRKAALVIGLIGELGSGKTTFIQGFAEGLGIKEKILSPTFVIMKKFQIPMSSKFFIHLDCYRIQKLQELLALGFADMVRNPHNIVIIEWADRVKKLLPQDALILRFKVIDEKTRAIKPSPG